MDSPSGTLAERRLGLAVGGLVSLPIGVLSGFTGVGGGEYRAPVLLTLLGRVRWVIAANLLIGFFVAVFNVVFRHDLVVVQNDMLGEDECHNVRLSFFRFWLVVVRKIRLGFLRGRVFVGSDLLRCFG